MKVRVKESVAPDQHARGNEIETSDVNVDESIYERSR